MNFADYPVDRLFFPAKSSFINRYADYLILCLVASVGLIGSIYVFTARSTDVILGNNTYVESLTPKDNNKEMITAIDQDTFDTLVKIEGSKSPGNELSITLQLDPSDARYYLDMGNKERIIFTQKTITYSYPEKGTYTMELKVLRNRLLKTIATKKVNVE